MLNVQRLAMKPYLYVQQPAIQIVGERTTHPSYRYKNKDKFDCAWAAKDPKKRCAKGYNEAFNSFPNICDPFWNSS